MLQIETLQVRGAIPFIVRVFTLVLSPRRETYERRRSDRIKNFAFEHRKNLSFTLSWIKDVSTIFPKRDRRGLKDKKEEKEELLLYITHKSPDRQVFTSKPRLLKC